MTTLYIDNHYITTLDELKAIIKRTESPTSVLGRQLLSALCDGVIYQWFKESDNSVEQSMALELLPEKFINMSGDVERLNVLRTIFDITNGSIKKDYNIEIVSKPNEKELKESHWDDNYQTIQLKFGIKCTENWDERVKLRVLNVEHIFDFNKVGVQTFIFELLWNDFKVAENIDLKIVGLDKKYWECDFAEYESVGHKYVDLGLSVKWATCNIGARTPYEYGDFFAWGEISTKNTYSFGNSITNGCYFPDISGKFGYDAAQAKWGGTWRLPTKDEMEELINKCIWTRIRKDNIVGYKVIGPNGNIIFLRCASGYWSSTPRENYNGTAWRITFGMDRSYVDYGLRYEGLPIRPVL